MTEKELTREKYYNQMDEVSLLIERLYRTIHVATNINTEDMTKLITDIDSTISFLNNNKEYLLETIRKTEHSFINKMLNKKAKFQHIPSGNIFYKDSMGFNVDYKGCNNGETFDSYFCNNWIDIVDIKEYLIKLPNSEKWVDIDLMMNLKSYFADSDNFKNINAVVNI